MEEKQDSDSHGVVGGFIGLVVVIALGVWVYNGWIKSDWQALYDDGASSHSLGDFSSKDACLSYIHERGYGECGKNCDPPKTVSGLYVCEETAD